MRNRVKYDTDETLSCMCAVASARLFFKLQDAGFSDAKLCVWEDNNSAHAFIHCAGYVVDVTATQFGEEYKPIEVRPIEEVTDEVWRVDTTLVTVEGMREQFKDWPEYQQPFPNR